jgi:hypothetical protein
MVSGFTNTAQQAGAALGLATLVAVAAARTGPGTTTEALRAGYSAAFLVSAAFMAAALLVAALLLRDPRNAAPAPALEDHDPVRQGRTEV